MLSCFCRVQFFETLGTIAHQAPLSMGFSRQAYWSGLSCTPPRDLPKPGTEPSSLMSPALVGRFFTTSTTREALFYGRAKCKESQCRNYFCFVQYFSHEKSLYIRQLQVELPSRWDFKNSSNFLQTVLLS